MACFPLSIPTNLALFSSRKHTPRCSHPLTAIVVALDPRERLPQCSEEANRRQTKPTRPRRRQILPTSEENGLCRVTTFIQCPFAYCDALAREDGALCVGVDHVCRGLGVFPEELERCAAFFHFSEAAGGERKQEKGKNSKKRSPLRGTLRVLAWRERRFSTEHSK